MKDVLNKKSSRKLDFEHFVVARRNKFFSIALGRCKEVMWKILPLFNSK